MGFFWFVIGVIIGLAVAWFYFNRQFAARLAERDREVREATRQPWPGPPAAASTSLSSSSARVATNELGVTLR